MGNRLSDEIKTQIIQDREAGMTCAAVARKYRVSDSVVSNVTREAFGDDYKTQEFKEWFRREWANIWPGDEVRKQRQPVEGQEAYEKEHTREEFVELFGKNYL